MVPVNLLFGLRSLLPDSPCFVLHADGRNRPAQFDYCCDILPRELVRLRLLRRVQSRLLGGLVARLRKGIASLVEHWGSSRVSDEGGPGPSQGAEAALCLA